MKRKSNLFFGIFIFISLFFSGLSWADTNGIWQFTNDTQGGIFGGDEQSFTTSYTFINPVYFDKPLISYTNPSFSIDLTGRTQLNDLVSNNLTTNAGKVNGNLIVTSTITGASISSSGTITGASISSPGTISGGTIFTSGAVSAAAISSSGTITANQLTTNVIKSNPGQNVVIQLG